MSRKVTVMNEVNNFVSINFVQCGKSTCFALDLGKYLGAAPLGISLGSNKKMLRVSTMPSNNRRTVIYL